MLYAQSVNQYGHIRAIREGEEKEETGENVGWGEGGVEVVGGARGVWRWWVGRRLGVGRWGWEGETNPDRSRRTLTMTDA